MCITLHMSHQTLIIRMKSVVVSEGSKVHYMLRQNKSLEKKRAYFFLICCVLKRECPELYREDSGN